MPKTKIILFDLDGTLRDTKDVIYDAMQHAIEVLGSERPKRADIEPHIHHHTAVHKALAGHVSLDEFEQVYKEALHETWDDVCLFDAAVETLEILSGRGYRLAIVTSAGSQSSLDFVNKQGIAHHFDAISGMGDGLKPKPAPDLVLRALELAGCNPEDAVMVGDLAADVLAAHTAGVRCVAITHGFGSRESLEAAGADYIIDSLSALPSVIEQIEQI